MHFDEMKNMLPKGWVWTKLGEIGIVASGGTPSTKDEDNFIGNIPWITPADLSDFRGKFISKGARNISEKGLKSSSAVLLPAGSILFSSRAPIGYVVIASNPISTNQGFKNLVLPKDIFNEYVFYYLKANKALAESLASGTTFLEISASKFAQIPLPLPPLPEQHRIVAKIEELFTRLDAGVDALKKIKAQLKRYRQAVLKYAFEGKLTQEWREANKDKLEPASVLLERIKEQRKKEAKGKFKELPPIDTSELPELPEGWVWTRIGDIADTIHYGYTASAEENKVGPKFLRISDIQSNSVNWDSVPYCRIDNSEKGKYLLKDGDLVFARTGATVGKSFLIRGNVPEAIFASYLIRIILDRRIDAVFVSNFFQSIYYWTQIQKGKIGIGQPNVNAQTLSHISLPLPPYGEQHKIVEEIESRLSIADNIEKVVEQSLNQAERLRQSILKRAFEGKLVPQDPTDEPAEILLERIRSERAKQSNLHKIKHVRRRKV